MARPCESLAPPKHSRTPRPPDAAYRAPLRTQQRKAGDPFKAAFEACIKGARHLLAGLAEEGPQLMQELGAVARPVEQDDQTPAEVVLETDARVTQVRHELPRARLVAGERACLGRSLTDVVNGGGIACN